MQTNTTSQQEGAGQRELTVTAPGATAVSDDMLALVAGGLMPVYVLTYSDDGEYVDFLYNF